MSDGPMSSDELTAMTCPRCGGAMTHGYIAGHWFRLRWVDRANTKTVFAGRPLRKKVDWWSTPSIEAARCERCKVGMFRYDY